MLRGRYEEGEGSELIFVVVAAEATTTLGTLVSTTTIGVSGLSILSAPTSTGYDATIFLLCFLSTTYPVTTSLSTSTSSLSDESSTSKRIMMPSTLTFSTSYQFNILFKLAHARVHVQKAEHRVKKFVLLILLMILHLLLSNRLSKRRMNEMKLQWEKRCVDIHASFVKKSVRYDKIMTLNQISYLLI